VPAANADVLRNARLEHGVMTKGPIEEIIGVFIEDQLLSAWMESVRASVGGRRKRGGTADL
jgi:hypothetical protein